uniref:RNase H type-1 domain-containing protein n=1 Tax=Nelumbo nucifera TaxID=4432 RepID=A0A822Z1A2_NELNU|nr:TPA_asm: hypothetical protein HUJ06_013094 [Nelumbo nucifera]
MKSHQMEDIQGVHHSDVHTLVSSWKLPDDGCLKLNSDGAFVSSSSVAFGMVVRNSSSRCLEVSFDPSQEYSPVQAEVVVVIAALKLATSLNCLEFTIESDCSQLLDYILNSNSGSHLD